MTGSAPGTVAYRDARAEDSRDIARLMCVAGGGLYEFLFDDLIPFVSAKDFLSVGIGGDSYPISHRHCRVATEGDGGDVIGMANVFPADLLKGEDHHLLSSERYAHIQPIMELQDWGSLFLNALAVDERCRGRGVGDVLLRWAQDRAKSAGFNRLSLHVWADNRPAMKFYRARGYAEIGVAHIAPHPRLPHEGGSVLMHRAA